MIVKFYLAALFLFVNINSFGQTQSEMNRDAANDYHKAQRELDSVYNKILKEYKKDTTFIKYLKKAQRLWVQLRQAEMEAKYPDRPDNEGIYYGSVLPMCWALYMTELTKERTEKLKEWLIGTEEGDVCSGTVQITKRH
jgi:uncharacterized protein YecT (DUF1311 family)